MIKNIVINPTLLKHLRIESPTLINPLNTINTINFINENKNAKFNVYDITHNKKHRNKEIISVSDHINCTGHNPLIGYQNFFSKPFIDISTIYKAKEGIRTTCMGAHFDNKKHQNLYPSTYLCYTTIILEALEKNFIKGFLVNTL